MDSWALTRTGRATTSMRMPSANRRIIFLLTRGNLKLDESCISDWTRTVQFAISDFGFEMQDSSNFKISSEDIFQRDLYLPWIIRSAGNPSTCGRVDLRIG